MALSINYCSLVYITASLNYICTLCSGYSYIGCISGCISLYMKTKRETRENCSFICSFYIAAEVNKCVGLCMISVRYLEILFVIFIIELLGNSSLQILGTYYLILLVTCQNRAMKTMANKVIMLVYFIGVVYIVIVLVLNRTFIIYNYFGPVNVTSS